LVQVAQLKNAVGQNRLSAKFERQVVGTGVLNRGESQKGVIDLLVRYADEWQAIAAKERLYGHNWPKLLDARRPPAQGASYASV
jgi:hypothetical protein